MGVIETVDIVKDLVARMPLMLKIDKVTNNGDGTNVIETCNTSYLQKTYSVSIGGELFLILEVVVNESVKLKGGTPPQVGSYLLDPPKFYHGTILKTNEELGELPDVYTKTPMVYLKRTFPETFFGNKSSIGREAKLNIFFLTFSDFEAWRTNDHDNNAVRPMRNVAYSFIDMLVKNDQIGLVDAYTLIDRIKFGVVVDIGTSKSYWTNDTLSGVELQIDLQIMKNYKCNCK